MKVWLYTAKVMLLMLGYLYDAINPAVKLKTVSDIALNLARWLYGRQHCCCSSGTAVASI